MDNTNKTQANKRNEKFWKVQIVRQKKIKIISCLLFHLVNSLFKIEKNLSRSLKPKTVKKNFWLEQY